MRGRALAVAPLICVLTLTPGGRPAAPDAPRATGKAFVTSFGSPATRVPVRELDGPATPAAYGDCGPDARPEPGLQGQVPLAEQESGGSRDGYRCNVRRVAQHDIGLRGQNFQLAWYEDCAYVSTIGTQAMTGANGEPAPELDGIAVLDASDARSPQLTDVISSPVAKSSHEALEVNQHRGLLVTTQGGLVARYIEVYDVREDCRHPRFLGRYDAGIPIFHGLRVSDDGRTVYATDTFQITGLGQMMHVVDITDPRRPTRLMSWDPLLEENGADQYGSHDLDVSEDGSRAYLGTAPYQALVGVVVAGPPSVGPGTSLAILDTSEVHARTPRADIDVVSSLSLPNIGHTVQRMRIGGKPYVLVSGEEPIGGPQNCPWAWGHIVDISDERNPRRVSDLRLEVNDIANCETASRDDGAIYSIHYVGVDDERDTQLVFYTYYTGGLRVFDVRDPEHPREVGYYHPPPTPGARFAPPMSQYTPDSDSAVLDYTTSMVRYRPETGELWLVSVNAGFEVLQLTGAAAPQHATVRVLRRRAGVAARTGVLPVEVSCAQPCSASVEARVGRRRAGRGRARVPLRGSRTVRVRLSRSARRALARQRRVMVSASASVADPLTGESQGHVRSPARPLAR